MREIVFDTETTGLSPDDGHKLVEIGAVELINHLPTGKTYHQYINPNRDIPEEAFRVHGLSYDFLREHPRFYEIAQDFLDFVGEDVLIAHNASFDMKFLNYELKHSGFKQLETSSVIDTLIIAKKLFPGAKNNLDALCRRFDIKDFDRSYHGALLDSQILARVYLELIGGREPTLINEEKKEEAQKTEIILEAVKNYREPRVFEVLPEETEAHINVLTKLKQEVW